MAISYLGSSNVKMFPSAYRGQSVDPEAYFTTEGNLTKSDVLGFANKSFVDEYDGTNITIVIKGYRFDTTKSAIQALAASGDSEIYADIKTDNKGTDGTFRTLVCYDDVASTILDDANNKFKGLAFASTKAQLSNDALLVLKLVDNTWGVPSASKLNVSPSQIRTSDSGDDLNKSLSEKVSTKDIVASGTLSVTGNTSIESNLTVGGAINYQSAETGTMTELLGLDNQGKIIKGTTLTGNLEVTGNSTTNGNLSVGGTTTLTGNLSAGGTTTSAGKITGNNGLEITSGETKLKTTSTGDLTSSKVTVNGRISASGQIYTTNNLEVVGTTLSRDKITGSNGLEISNGNTSLKNTSVTGTLSASGVASITNDTQATTMSDGALKVSGGVGVAKNLVVGGDLIVQKLNGVQVGSNLNQFTVNNDTGAIHSHALAASTVGVDNALSIDSDGLVKSADISSSYTRTADSGEGVKILSGITQDSNGKITSYSETNLPLATNLQAGLVSGGNQTFGGLKTFNGGINAQLQCGNFAVCTTVTNESTKDISLSNFPSPNNIPVGTHIFVLFKYIRGGYAALRINGINTQYPEYIGDLSNMATWRANTIVELVKFSVEDAQTGTHNYWVATNTYAGESTNSDFSGIADFARETAAFTNVPSWSTADFTYSTATTHGYPSVTLNSEVFGAGKTIQMFFMDRDDYTYYDLGTFTLPNVSPSSHSWDYQLNVIINCVMCKLTIRARWTSYAYFTAQLEELEINGDRYFQAIAAANTENLGRLRLYYRQLK